MSIVSTSSRQATPRSGQVPFLPGQVPKLLGRNQGAHDLSKSNHPIRQTLDFSRDAAVDRLRPESSQQVPRIDMELLKTLQDPAFRLDRTTRSMTHDERAAEKESARNTSRPGNAPAWLKHDRQVLRFFAYFQEPVHENPNENLRVRLCHILYYLEDGTMQVCEPKVVNSGIPQGVLIKRHRLPRPEYQGGGFYAPADLKCGVNVTIYAKVFKIVDCDEYTRWFYETAAHMDVGQPQDAPMDSFREAQCQNGNATAATMTTREVADSREYTELRLGGSRRNVKLAQYLANDRRVLCFHAFWDDPTRYGSRQYFTLHYHLADDSIEVLECLGRNAGRDPYPVFWRRAPLRKNPVISATPGMLEPEAVIVKPEDLAVGGSVDVLGREVSLYGCDEFTREFYRQYMNQDMEDIEIKEHDRVHVKLSYPPHTGIGQPEDSLASCLHLTPRQPRKDVAKLTENDGKVLRFEACMVNDKSEDMNRRFIVNFFLADDGVAIWEQKTRNSGHVQGKFAERSRKPNPATGTWFKKEDFFVGATIVLNGTPFKLHAADGYTQNLLGL